jgi:hypothetical protein
MFSHDLKKCQVVVFSLTNVVMFIHCELIWPFKHVPCLAVHVMLSTIHDSLDNVQIILMCNPNKFEPLLYSATCLFTEHCINWSFQYNVVSDLIRKLYTFTRVISLLSRQQIPDLCKSNNSQNIHFTWNFLYDL